MTDEELDRMRDLLNTTGVPYIAHPEAVHQCDCPATSMAKSKRPWKCTCGAQDLFDKFEPLWRRFMEGGSGLS